MGEGIELRGVIPPLVTPLDPNGNVDAESLKRLVDFVIRGGVSGIFVLGSTGEGAYLPPRQQVEAAAAALEAARGRVSVLGGVLCPGTPQAVARARALVRAGVDAVVLTAPYYYSCTADELERHFREVRQAVDVPLLAYDVPPHVGLKLDLELLFSLYARGVIQGIKDSTGDFARLRRLLYLRPAGLGVFVGTEEWADMALLSGAEGVIPGLANVLPGTYRQIYNCAMRGDVAGACAAQEKILRTLSLMDVLEGSFTRRALGLFKILLWKIKVIEHFVVMPPFGAFSESEVKRLLKEVEKLGFFPSREI